MSRKILFSLAMIAFAGAVIVGATGAFFSDTETSTGNTFTAGAIDLKVDSQQHYNNAVCTNGVWALEAGQTAQLNQYPVIGSACDGSWELTDLGVQKFFNFGDVKPGDSGENTISLHVDNNDAWACVDVDVTKNDDKSSTEPELEDGDTAEDAGNILDGELAQNVYFTAWADDGDNKWESGEPLLFSNVNGPASDVLDGKTYALADSQTGAGLPMAPGSTRYIGLAWCAGAQTVDTSANTISCNGSSMDNKTQTDSMEASVTFRVEQSRNNEGFVCTAPTNGETGQKVGAKLSAYSAPTSCDITVDKNGGDVSRDTIQEGVNLATAGQTVCVKAGTYTEDVNVNKSITLAGDGPTLVTLTGVGTGEAGALVVTADNVTVKGFKVVGTGVSALRISGARAGDTFSFNNAVAATGKNAFLTDGGQSNHTISNNVFEGNASQLVYVNGNVDVALPSTNIDFISNTFGGTATGPLLGISANGSSITLNKFSGTTSYTSIESWEGNNIVNQNNFNVVGQKDVTNGVLAATQFPDTLNAENNWWGDTTPADNVTGLVDFTPSEASAFPEN